MSFPTFFGGVILLAVIAPTQVAELGGRLMSGLAPIIEQGFILALMFAAIVFVWNKIS